MKKSDLKSGMVVKFREYDTLFILINDAFYSYDGESFIKLSKYDDELYYIFNESELDIVEVYKCKWPNVMSCFIDRKLELIWKREETEKEVTYEELDKRASKFCESNLSDKCKQKGCGECITKFIYDNYNVTRK